MKGWRPSPYLQLGLGLGLVLGGLALRGAGPARVATFNLENFREDDVRTARLMEEIRATDASIVAVQEVRATETFAAAAREHLGGQWRFVHAGAGHAQRVGLVFDGARATLLEPARTLEQTLIGERAKAALYARFAVEGRSRPLRVFVVHLTSGRSRAAVRARQIDALTPLVVRAARSGDEVVVLGDFNSVTPADHDAIAQLAERAELEWVSHDVPCSTYWQREEACEAATLDHVLATDADDVSMHGGCASDGCGPMDRCPAYRDEVSDHCALSIALP